MWREKLFYRRALEDKDREYAKYRSKWNPEALDSRVDHAEKIH
jgi:hypothetical protein